MLARKANGYIVCNRHKKTPASKGRGFTFMALPTWSSAMHRQMLTWQPRKQQERQAQPRRQRVQQQERKLQRRLQQRKPPRQREQQEQRVQEPQQVREQEQVLALPSCHKQPGQLQRSGKR